jgi:ribonuclease-3
VAAQSKLQYRLGYEFVDQDLLTRALTHRSHHVSHQPKGGPGNYERLEFLGDSILGFIIAEYLYHRFHAAREGQLSRLRARIVRRETLAEVARTFDVGDFMIMGSGELKSGGFERASILSDVLEAIIGGIYLEAGLEVVRERVLHWFASQLEALTLMQSQKDPKSLLQEFLQSRQQGLPIYSIVGVEGKSHDQIFTVDCRIAMHDEVLQGVATSRRDAEQIAATKALDSLGVNYEQQALNHD